MAKSKGERGVILARVDEGTHDKIKELARLLGYTYGSEGSVGRLLDAIARGEIILTKSLTHPKK